MPLDKVRFCPKCLKPVEARDYFTSGGISSWRAESIGTTIECPKCGYSGPPVEVGLEDYKKLMKKKK